jgi:hypothetical protein
MMQLGFHLLGDYILQNGWMSRNKKQPGRKGFTACVVHCTVYSLPFLFIASWPAVLAIGITHFIIDRHHLVEWFIATREGAQDFTNKGFPPNVPPFLSVWLYIITDNIFHLACNYWAIRLLP